MEWSVYNIQQVEKLAGVDGFLRNLMQVQYMHCRQSVFTWRVCVPLPHHCFAHCDSPRRRCGHSFLLWQLRLHACAFIFFLSFFLLLSIYVNVSIYICTITCDQANNKTIIARLKSIFRKSEREKHIYDYLQFNW